MSKYLKIKIEKPIKMSDTSLCAIVRDERINPAGGIADFIESIAPYVEEAIVVDTGSVDGTREILEDLKLKHHNLRIFDRQFDGFASSRNFSLDQAQTRYSLILDADERLTIGDFADLSDFMKKNPELRYRFEFLHINPEGECSYRESQSIRLFKNCEQNRFKVYAKDIWEYLPCDNFIFELETPVKIKHFIPDKKGYNQKRHWYNLAEHQLIRREETISPSMFEGFEDWKKINPHRDKFENI